MRPYRLGAGAAQQATRPAVAAQHGRDRSPGSSAAARLRAGQPPGCFRPSSSAGSSRASASPARRTNL
eukprot:14548102-Alexandrium_andersonii.AAC.1